MKKRPMYIFHDVDETLVPQTSLPVRRAEPYWKKGIFFFRKKAKKVSETYERCGGERGEVGGKAQAWTGGA